jgi:hypothetical protein
MLEFLGITITDPIPIYENNQAVLFLTETVKVHPRIKPTNKVLNFNREFIQQGVINLIKVHTSQNVADIMTKNLDVKQFLFLRPLLLGTYILTVNYMKSFEDHCHFFIYTLYILVVRQAAVLVLILDKY